MNLKKSKINLTFYNDDIFVLFSSYFVHFQKKIYNLYNEKEIKKSKFKLQRFNAKLFHYIRSLALNFVKEYEDPVKKGKIIINILPEDKKVIFNCKGTEEEINKWVSYQKNKVDYINIASKKAKIMEIDVIEG